MLFKYKVNYWDGYDDGSKSKEELGLVAGKTYGDACDKVVKYYGTDSLVDITLEAWDDVACVNEIIGGLKL